MRQQNTATLCSRRLVTLTTAHVNQLHRILFTQEMISNIATHAHKGHR